MAYVGGKWTIPSDILPGARINVISKDKASGQNSERGIVAIPLELDWGLDTEVQSFVPTDYTRDAIQKFGYETGSEKLKNISELFCGATKLVIARLNGDGEYAKSEIGTAKYPGTRGNDIAVTVEGDPDMGTEENPLAKVNVSFSSSENKVTAVFENIPEGYTPNLKVTKEDTNIKCDITTDNSKVVASFANTVQAVEYKVIAIIEKGSVSYTISTATVNVTIQEATESKIKLTKGSEEEGENPKETVVTKYGFVKNKTDLDSITKPTTSSGLTNMTEDIWYFSFKEAPTDGNQYAAIFEVDGTKYAQPLWNETKNTNLYICLKEKPVGGFINEGSEWKANSEDKTADVSGKTVKLSLYKYDKKVDLEAIKGEPTEKLLEEESIDCTSSVAKNELGVDTPVTVTFEVSENTFKASWTDVAEYTFSTKILKGAQEYSKEDVTKDEQKNEVTYTFAKTVPTGEDWKLEVHAYKDKDVMVKSCTATAAVEGEDKDAAAKTDYQSAQKEEFQAEIPSRYIVTTYLDGVEVDIQKNKTLENIKDNNFVIFDRTKPLKESGGILFTGGTNSEVTVQSYTDALNRLESQIFHILACPSNDEKVKQMFVTFTSDCRDKGIKFQTVMAQTETKVNHEGVIQVYNRALNCSEPETALVYWVAGQQAGCEVQDSVANREYTGQYKVDLDHTQRELENAITGGYFCFHQARGIDREQHCKTLLDINTLTDYRSDQNEDWSRNDTIRVVDDICLHLADVFNNQYFGHVKNNTIGREMFRNEIISYLDELQTKNALDSYDEDYITVMAAENPVAIIVQAAIVPARGLEQLYMTLVIE